MPRHIGWAFGLVVIMVTVLFGVGASGHAPIASRYTYNEHLFPILQQQCGSCHVEGGVAPMSLMTYDEAFPWTQSIREEVLSLRMPPWRAEDGFGTFTNGHVLPAHEMDMILEWSAGGHPRGPREQTPTAPALTADWTLGPPTVELTLPEPFTIDAATSEAVRYFTLQTDLDGDRWVTGVDIIPGARAVVRHISIYIDTTGQASAADAADAGPGFASGYDGDEPIVVWWPGQSAVKHDGVGYALPAGADLVARVLYKKTWITEGQAFSDQTRFGLHLAEDGVSGVEHTVVSSPEELDGRELVFSHTLDRGVNLLGLLPEVAVEALELEVEGVLPDGARVPLLLIREPDHDWPTRYWLDTPRSLPAGTQIEVSATLRPGSNPLTIPSLFGAAAPIRLLLDYTSAADAAN